MWTGILPLVAGSITGLFMKKPNIQALPALDRACATLLTGSQEEGARLLDVVPPWNLPPEQMNLPYTQTGRRQEDLWFSLTHQAKHILHG